MAVNWHNHRNLIPDLDLRSLRSFLARLRRHLNAVGLPCGKFDVTLAGDCELAKLNHQFRGKDGPTDVLSFPWQQAAGAGTADESCSGELEGFIGDIVISAETAASNARGEGHSLCIELEQLILHGALHLLGYDHERDHGEMDSLELGLRQELGIE